MPPVELGTVEAVRLVEMELVAVELCPIEVVVRAAVVVVEPAVDVGGEVGATVEEKIICF